MVKVEIAQLETNKKVLETRPRIPLNAAAGSVSSAISGITEDDCEQMPIVYGFRNYNYTIQISGVSMEPEFHSGDEVACLALKPNSFEI